MFKLFLRHFSVSPRLELRTRYTIFRPIRKLTRFRIVDNSAIGQQARVVGKPAKCINIYHPSLKGTLGDKVLVAVMGQMKKAYIVGVKGYVHDLGVARFDTNNIVLVDDMNQPLGTRITVPIPSCLRAKGPQFAKILAIATKFV